MAVKNYYVVLGVPRSETLDGIRTAYRDLAKRFHPDRVGDEGTRSFQEISEAYGVLSDPERRRAHDRELDEERSPRIDARRPAPRNVRGGRVEPLIPEARRRHRVEPLDERLDARRRVQPRPRSIFEVEPDLRRLLRELHFFAR